MNQSLFSSSLNEPLAAKARPKSLDDFAGQQHLIAQGKILRRIIDSDKIPSMIFWGPPGVGKTTLASIIAAHTHAHFINFSAVTSGIKEIRTVMQQAEENRRFGKKTIVFVDEIHRFNKAQQDAFLPFVEKGSIILIGATTENPSFEVNGALLSRCKVFVLQALTIEDLVTLLRRALEDVKGEGSTIKRKGLVLAYMLRFKQICDHPSLYLGTEAYKPEDSGKFVVLGERHGPQDNHHCGNQKSLHYTVPLFQ